MTSDAKYVFLDDIFFLFSRDFFLLQQENFSCNIIFFITKKHLAAMKKKMFCSNTNFFSWY